MFKRNNYMRTSMLSAILLSVVGAVTAMMFPQSRSFAKKMGDQTSEFADRARQRAEDISEDIRGWARPPKKTFSTNVFLLGGALGGLLGAATAFLCTPQSGNELIKNISKRYKRTAQSTEKLLHPTRNSHLNGSKKPKAASSKKSSKKASAVVNEEK